MSMKNIENQFVYCIPVSARNEVSLSEKVADLQQWLNSTECTGSIFDIAYTLGAGRDHYEMRIAFVVSGIEELKGEVDKFRKGERSSQSFISVAPRGKQQLERQGKELVNQVVSRIHTSYQEVTKTDKDDVKLLSSLYVAGYEVDFEQIYQGLNCYKLSMPTYPYQSERYWVGKKAETQKSVERLHPLLDCNSSTIEVEKFRKKLYGTEFFMKDHQVGSLYILPGVAYLEMAYSAVLQAGVEKKVTGFQGVQFLNPLKLDRIQDCIECEICLYPEQDDIAFEVVSEQNGATILHAQGNICFGEEVANHTSQEGSIPQTYEITGATCYEKLRNRGLKLGPSFQAIQCIANVSDGIWSKLSLPEHLLPEFEQFHLHPSLVDGALETVIGLLSMSNQENSDLSMPFAIDRIRLYGELGSKCYSYAKESKDTENDSVRKYDVEILNEQGERVIALEGFSLKKGQYRRNDHMQLYYVPTWKERELIKQEKFVTEPKIFGEEDIKETDSFVHYDSNLQDYTMYEQELAKITLELQTLIRERGKKQASFYYVYHSENLCGRAMAAYLRSVQLEYNQIYIKTIGVDDIQREKVEIEDEICYDKEAIEVIYSDNKRYVREMEEVQVEPTETMKLTEHATYLVVGGAGGLGFKLVEKLATEHEVIVVVIGRSELSTKKKERFQALSQGKSKIVYIPCDITSKESVKELHETIRRQYGEVRGIFQCAGVTKDCKYLEKNLAMMQAVINPKLLGTSNLDEEFAKEPLDFIVLYSSIASITGNHAQCDYSFANRFMDEYAMYHNELVKKGKRHGVCISIAWSYWENGGILLDEATKALFQNSFGIVPLADIDGEQALNVCLSRQWSNVLVVKGNKKKIEKNLGIEKKKLQVTGDKNVAVDQIMKYVHTSITDVVCKLLKMKAKDVSFTRDMSEYGFNSLTLTDFTNLLNEEFHITLTPAVFFECSSLEELANHMMENHLEELQQNMNSNANEVEEEEEILPMEEEVTYTSKKQGRRRINAAQVQTSEQEPIVIVGMSGVMPDAENVEEYWNNLIEHKDCIRTIPKDRWNWEDYNKTPEQTISKWGGFMKEVNEFDAEFFGISPREARLMDPQQRLFMQVVWKTIEDAGYDAKDLSGADMGLFVGVATSDYSEVLREHNVEIEAYTSTGASHCILANRISYLFNWSGPSEPIDTACSSSLIAIHRAVSSIRNGDCSMAIAGGVNVITSPLLHIAFSKAGMLSPDGRCKTFDQKADGYVRGEGAGAIFLKPLSQAIKDHDHIYGVVKSTAINHGGHANSLTAPNPKAQAKLIVKAFEKAEISPDTIGYIEAHGTGTNLGDPAEINGLKAAFKQMYENRHMTMNRKNYCHISSVKTNIGHLEAAAGIASVLKVIMALKYKTIPGNVHLKNLNPYIEIKDSPFAISAENEPWERLSAPRRAGISSFGFGGANAHIVIEEYVPEAKKQVAPKNETQLVVLSARNKERRDAYVASLYEFLQKEKRVQLCDLAYTLQTGRKLMDCRFATYVDSIEELCEVLKEYIEHPERPMDKVFVGEADNSVEELTLDELKKKVAEKRWSDLARYYVQGGSVDWKAVAGTQNAYHVSLPTYPFAKEQYWVPEGKKVDLVQAALHPLLDQNQSDLTQIKFVKSLKRSEFFVHDHVVNGQMLLPGVAYLEMARAAGEKVGLGKNLILKDIMWAQPIILTKDTFDVSILIEKLDSRVKFTICSDEQGKRVTFCEGYLEKLTQEEVPRTYQVSELQQRCQQVLTREECYQGLYHDVGFEYGKTFQVTNQLRSNDDEVIAELELPKELSESASSFVLHPSLLDGAIRNIAGMGHQVHDSVHIPFALGKLTVFGSIPEHCYGYSTIVKETKQNENGTKRFHMSVLNERGEEVVRIQDFTARPYRKPNHQMLYLVPEWNAVPSNEFMGSIVDLQQEKIAVVLIGGTKEQKDKICPILQSQVSKLTLVESEDISEVMDLPEESFDVAYLMNLRYLMTQSTNQAMLETYLEDQVALYKKLGTKVSAKKVKCIDFVTLNNSSDSPLLHAALAFEKSFVAIDRKYEHQAVGIAAGAKESDWVNAVLRGSIPKGKEIVYRQNEVVCQSLKEVQFEGQAQEVIQPNGVYIITGGTGRIGMMFAMKLAGTYKAKLVINGRTANNEEIQKKIEKLKQMGADVVYFGGDVATKEVAEELVAFTKRTYNHIDGVFHCAGALSKDGILEASKEEIHSILNPKVSGTMNLREALKDEKHCFLALFSSVSSLLGDFGGVSYAVANSFADYVASTCNKNEQPMTLAINWPLWKHGNMQLPKEKEAEYFEMTGLDAIEFDDAFRAFTQCLAQKQNQVVVAIGERQRICQSFKVAAAQKSQSTLSAETTVNENELRTKTKEYLTKIIAETIGIDAKKIQPKLSFENYGIDSLMIMDLNKKLEKDFQGLRKTLFFECSNLNELTDFFVENYESTLVELLEIHEEREEVEVTETFEQPEVIGEETFDSDVSDDDIAIIGLNGKYPMANDLAEFWTNLKEGKDCITEIPKDRFEYEKYYSSNKAEKNKIYCKWGGFLEDVDTFDPMFFKITPKDAQIIDPQERLFLENVYGTLDDAGYTKESLAKDKVGVFVGVMYGHYQLYGALESAKGNLVSLSSSYASIANRISYYFDFKGPSIAMDTMCSSSLTAIHLACESILRHECDVAVAGGVNVTIHLDKYIFMCQQRFASSNGACRAFGIDGNGYVPGEGVGSVLLKPLKKAIKDHDNIYGVIKASAINHGGKTSGFSVPSPNAQGEVISEALKKAKINPRTISYVEAHGTGTELGDPIEITGLMKAYGSHTKDTQFCEIGSVKTNIGHAESAAGIASLTKVLLQMKNKSYVPSLHSKVKNPNIDFEHTPFIVSQEAKEWQAPIIVEDGVAKTYPRRAGVSSFGAGGSNAHLIVEEYQKQEMTERSRNHKNVFILSARNEKALGRYVSAMCEYLTDALYEKTTGDEKNSLVDEMKQMVADLLNVDVAQIAETENLEDTGMDLVGFTALSNWIYECYQVRFAMGDLSAGSIMDIVEKLKGGSSTSNLVKRSQPSVAMDDVAYTMQVGREEIDGIRLAVVASSLEELLEKYQAYQNGSLSDGCYKNKIKASDLDQTKMDELQEECNGAIRAQEFETIAKLWVEGCEIAWASFYPQSPYRISLPTYPFEKLHCWYEPSEPTQPVQSVAVQDQCMIDNNNSTLDGISFSKNLTMQQKCLRDHVVKGEHMLPGVAYLEMAWEAAMQSKSDVRAMKIKNVAWMKPVIMKETESRKLEIALKSGKNYVNYEIFSNEKEGKNIYNRGCIDYIVEEREVKPQTIDLKAIKERCTNKIEGKDLYSVYRSVGIEYGESLQSVQTIVSNETEALSNVISLENTADANRITLFYSVMDAALQSLAGFATKDSAKDRSLLLPFALEELEVRKKLSKNCYVYCKKLPGGNPSGEKYDIFILDENGEVAILLHRFMGRYYQPEGQQKVFKEAPVQDPKDILYRLQKGEITLEEAKRLLQ